MGKEEHKVAANADDIFLCGQSQGNPKKIYCEFSNLKINPSELCDLEYLNDVWGAVFNTESVFFYLEKDKAKVIRGQITPPL